MVDNLYFWYCVEFVIGFLEVNDALTEFIDLDTDIPQESADCPSSHDHDCLWVHFGQIEFHGKP